MSDPYDIPGADQSAENGQAVKHEGTPPGARLDSSVPGWDSPLLAVRSDSVRTARYRRHQAWFREVQLGVAEAGIGANGKAVSSMLPTGAVADRPDLNFLVPAAYAHAARRIALVRAEGGTMEEDRLRRNLLSSMPLCFNIFGAIGTHPAFPQLLRLLFDPDVADLDAVECEWAPQPPSNHLDDRSAFDAFVAYRHESGRSCFVGIETKYTEPFSPYKYEKPAYRRVTEESGWFKPGAYDALKGSKTNQLWRTTMLAASMVDGDRFQWGKVLLLTCADDTGAAECAALVREQLLDPSRLVHTTYEAVVDAARQVDDSDLAQWADQFERRYLIDTTAPDPSEQHADGPSFTRPLRNPDRSSNTPFCRLPRSWRRSLGVSHRSWCGAIQSSGSRRITPEEARTTASPSNRLPARARSIESISIAAAAGSYGATVTVGTGPGEESGRNSPPPTTIDSRSDSSNTLPDSRGSGPPRPPGPIRSCTG